jgi:hypothetical protein
MSFRPEVAGCTREKRVPQASNTSKSSQSERRRQRLAAELRANLGKRKAQTRARAEANELPGRHGTDKPDKR